MRIPGYGDMPGYLLARAGLFGPEGAGMNSSAYGGLAQSDDLAPIAEPMTPNLPEIDPSVLSPGMGIPRTPIQGGFPGQTAGGIAPQGVDPMTMLAARQSAPAPGSAGPFPGEDAQIAAAQAAAQGGGSGMDPRIASLLMGAGRGLLSAERGNEIGSMGTGIGQQAQLDRQNRAQDMRMEIMQRQLEDQQSARAEKAQRLKWAGEDREISAAQAQAQTAARREMLGAIGDTSMTPARMEILSRDKGAMDSYISERRENLKANADAEEARLKREEAGTPKLTDINTMRKGWRDETKDDREAIASYERMLSIGKDVEAMTGADDIALMFAYMKAQDPDSSVREGEFRTVGEAGGLPGQIQAIYGKWSDGKRLTGEQRTDLLNAAGSAIQPRFKHFDEITSAYEGIGSRNNVNREDIITGNIASDLRSRAFTPVVYVKPDDPNKTPGVRALTPEEEDINRRADQILSY